jgi:hypothetical protein
MLECLTAATPGAEKYREFLRTLLYSLKHNFMQSHQVDFGRLLVCCFATYSLPKNPKNIYVAIMLMFSVWFLNTPIKSSNFSDYKDLFA